MGSQLLHAPRISARGSTTQVRRSSRPWRRRILSLGDIRFVLGEPPHHEAPPRLEEFFFNVVTAGYVPIRTHPELTWIKSSYQTIRRLAQSGVWMQITAVSLTGAFGRTTRFPAEQVIDEGCVHILATDTRTMCDRSPNLGEGREFAALFRGGLC